MAESKSRQAKTTQDTPDDGVAREVQRVTNEAEEQGFFGVQVDPTDNEAYTVAGVTANRPTPENDRGYAAEVRRQLDDADRAR